MNNKRSILYLTDFYYPAKGREYYKEDFYIISELKEDFEVLICHPTQSKNFESLVDIVVFRNTGSVMYYKQYFEEFVERVNSNSIAVYNEMTGKGDMKGKQHLLDLTQQQYPVIPTIENISDIDLLPKTDNYILKLKNGADSIGMKTASFKELQSISLKNYIIQPYIDFEYEVSFYYIDDKFQYALYAPNKSKRWELQEYPAKLNDINFADKFINWNTLKYGIQRVDACRLKNGKLLLVELEDLNPYLSIDVLSLSNQKNFIHALNKSILNTIHNNKAK